MVSLVASTVVYRRQTLLVKYWLSLHNWDAPALEAEAHRLQNAIEFESAWTTNMAH